MLVQQGRELCLRLETADSLDHLATFEQHQRRDGADLMIDRHLSAVVSIDLADLHFSRVVIGLLINGRGKHLAGTAPWCPEIDQNGLIR